MNAIFEQVARNLRVRRTIGLFESGLRILAEDELLAEVMSNQLDTGLAPSGEPAWSCAVDYTTHHPGWRDWLPSRRTREIRDPFVGRATIYMDAGGSAFLEHDIGVVFHDGDGRMVCLAEPMPPDTPPGRLPNLTHLANVVASEAASLSGKLLVHAGAVGRDGRCRVWAGESGAGKTTHVLWLAGNGWDFYGDDQVAVERVSEGLWRVWPFWRAPKISADTCRLVPGLAHWLERIEPGRKLDVRVEDLFPMTRPGPGTIESIHILDPNPETETRRLSPAEAFQSAAPLFIHGLWPGGIPRAMDTVLDLVTDVPVLRVPRTRL